MLLTLRKIVILYMQTDKFMFSYLILLFAICFFLSRWSELLWFWRNFLRKIVETEIFTAQKHLECLVQENLKLAELNTFMDLQIYFE